MPHQVRFQGCDFSFHALSLFRRNQLFEAERIELLQWDVTESFPQEFPEKGNLVLVIFVLSSLHPDLHINTLRNIRNIMEEGTYLLFRDYAIHDMTMLRHKIRYSSSLFRRQDGTLVHYFSREQLEMLASSAGFKVVECEYATVANTNRKTGVVMRRVFIHAVLQKVD